MLERDMRLVRLTGGALPRGDDLLQPTSVDILRAAQEAGVAGHLRRLDQQPGAERKRHRRLPHLPASSRRRFAMRTTGRRSIAALAEGAIDVIVSDHNPQDVETKRLPFAEAADGAVGLETLLSAALRLVHAGQIALPELLRALSTRPAEILGLPAGRLAARCAGRSHRCSIPKRPTSSTSASCARRSKNTPFDEARLEGQVTVTLGCGQDRVRPPRTRSTALSGVSHCRIDELVAVDGPSCSLALRRSAISLGSIPFGVAADALCRARRHPQGRVGQYRRDERAAHRSQRVSPRRHLSAMP